MDTGEAVMRVSETWMNIGVPHSTYLHGMSGGWAAMQEELGDDRKLTFWLAEVQRTGGRAG